MKSVVKLVSGIAYRNVVLIILVIVGLCSASAQSKLIKNVIEGDGGSHFFIRIDFDRHYNEKKVKKAIENLGYYIYKYERKKFQQFGNSEYGYSKVVVTTSELKGKYDQYVIEQSAKRRQQRAVEQEQTWGAILGALVVVGGAVSAFSNGESSSSTTITYVPYKLKKNVYYAGGSGNTTFWVKEKPSGSVKLRDVGVYVQKNDVDRSWWIVVSPPNNTAGMLSEIVLTYKYFEESRKIYKASEFMSGSLSIVESYVDFDGAVESASQDWINKFKFRANWPNSK